MEKKIFIRQELEEDNEDRNKEIECAHKEAMEFVEKHRDFLEHYARGEVKIEPVPEGLKTFAFDLENNTIYVNSLFYKTAGFSFSDEKTLFATCHELEHFAEKKLLLAEDGGEKLFGDYLKKLEESRAYGVMDNCLADIKENRAVIKKTNEGYGDIERTMYKENLFKEIDFTNQPKHIQLPQAILRESRLSDEMCQVAPEVREKLDQLRAIKSANGDGLLDIMTNPDVPMSVRLKLQDLYIWPMVRELLEKDLEDEKNKKEGGGEDGSEGEGEGKDGDGEKKEKPDPNQIFKDAYDKADKKIPNAVPTETVKKAFKGWQESKGENPLERADNEYAEKLGVKKADLEKYRNTVKSFEKIINPETGENIIQELRNLIKRIIAKRLKPAEAPRYPVEEGEDLVDPALLVSDVKAGNLEPKVWETTDVKEKRGDRFGEVEITLVCDRSSSMAEKGGAKLREQQKAAVLMMEALKEFAEKCDEEKVNLEKPLEIKSEIYSFQQDSSDSTPLKKMSKELGEKERIEAASILSSAPGGTTDFIPLEAINKNLDDEIKKKISEGDLKKIVIIFTDGASNDADRTKKILKILRLNGIIAIGVGITEDGEAALETYAPDARLAKKAEELALILAELLKTHLAGI